ncbi:hypothetical protein RKD37_001619 [Streptomyces ambofaciens]
MIRIAPRAARVPRKAHSQSMRPVPKTSAARRAEADQDGGVGQVGADPVQVDAAERVLLAPAGDLAVDAVQQQIQLDRDHAEHRAPDARHEQRRGRQHAADGHQVRELVGRDPGVHQVAVDPQRDLTHVEASRPVLTAAPVLDPRGMDDRA